MVCKRVLQRLYFPCLFKSKGRLVGKQVYLSICMKLHWSPLLNWRKMRCKGFLSETLLCVYYYNWIPFRYMFLRSLILWCYSSTSTVLLFILHLLFFRHQIFCVHAKYWYLKALHPIVSNIKNLVAKEIVCGKSLIIYLVWEHPRKTCI